MKWAKAAVAVLVVVAASVLKEARAHGWLAQPHSRQFCPGTFWNLKYLRGGGSAVDALRNNNDPRWGGMPGLCGDPFIRVKRSEKTSNFVGTPCEVDVPQYQAGGNIEIKVNINVNHWGSFKFYLCDRQDDLTQECFDKYPLVNAYTGEEEYWIMERKNNLKVGDKKIDQYTMTYKLPEGVSCERCVLQWTWWTKMGCSFPCEKSKCGWNHDLTNPNRKSQKFRPRECPTRNPKPGVPPQMYRNCADISIGGSGSRRKPTVNKKKKQELYMEEDEAKAAGEAAMNRRNLLAAVEEIDSIYDISSVGMAMDCMNKKVDDLLQSLNDVRAESGLPGLLCSNKATGVAADFSYLTCEQKSEFEDKEDNCRLSEFTGGCHQIVTTRHPLQALSAKDYEVINDPAVKVGAAGFRKCGDGHTYWTLLLGGWETDLIGVDKTEGN